MADLIEKIEMVRKFGMAIQNGLEKSAAALPIVVRQQITTKAKTKLHSTLEPYLDGIQTDIENMVFIVDIDKDNWLANALEVGVSPFDMKNGLLNSPKAKTGKSGKKYIHVPIMKDAKRKADTMGTEKSQEYQRLIEHVMRKPKYGASTLKHQSDGTVIETQKVITDEPKLQGFYRFRKLDSAKRFFSGKTQGIPFQHVMFRTVSENGSKTGADWSHPGIKALNIFKEIERELPQIFEKLLDSAIQAELRNLLR